MKFEATLITGAKGRVSALASKFNSQGSVIACQSIAPRFARTYLASRAMPTKFMVDRDVLVGSKAYSRAHPDNTPQVLDFEILGSVGLELDGNIITAMAPWPGGMPVGVYNWYPGGLPSLSKALLEAFSSRLATQTALESVRLCLVPCHC